MGKRGREGPIPEHLEKMLELDQRIYDLEHALGDAQRETATRIASWLRSMPNRFSNTHHAELADAIERGEWKESK